MSAPEVRALLAHAQAVYADHPVAHPVLAGLSARLEEPLRVAVAGMVKAGKSTLINALIGEEIAPTDAGECTQVVTWYRYGTVPAVTLHPRHGAPRPLPVRRTAGRLVLDLDGDAPEDVDHLVVDWPTPSLRDLVLIDTPGIASLSAAVSARTAAALTPDEGPAQADVVIYLMRHLRGVDVQFLQAFQDAAGAGGANALVVLARADEVGAGRLDALVSARDIAARYREDEALVGLALGVIPVAGLLAQSARTLRQTEIDALVALAELPRADADALLVSADRFTTVPTPVDRATRAALLDRLGIFGVRLALVLIRAGTTDPTDLAHELARRSGLGELTRAVATQFQSRAADLRARTAVTAVERLLAAHPAGEELEAALERVQAGAHAFTELRLTARARTTGLGLSPDRAREAERLIGAHGTRPHQRLGLPPGAPPAVVRDAALDAVHRWRVLAAHPLTARSAAEVCAAVVRSCEGTVAVVGAD